MPRLIHKPPAYSLHKPSGLARVRFRGKDHYLGRFGSKESLEAYSRLLARLVQNDVSDEPGSGPEAAPSVLTIAELIDKFWEHAKRYYRRDGRPTGEHVVIRAAHRPLLDLYGSVPVAEFTPKHLKLVRSEMIRLDWSRRHINAQVRRIKRMFFWAVEEGLVSGAVCYSLQEVKALRKHRSDAREKPEVGPVADEHVKAVVPYVSEVVADVIRVMRLSGMRPGEACAMMVEQIDRTDPECWRYVPGAHKTQHRGKPRVIFLGPKCQQILTRRILKAGTGRVFPISRSSVRTAIIRGCRRASVPNWSPNQLRHAAATEIRAKYGIEGAQVILGHSQVTTSQIYAEVNVERGREIAKLVG